MTQAAAVALLASDVRQSLQHLMFVNRNDICCSSTVDRISAIERARVRAGLSHEELCRRAGIQARNWYQVRAGKHAPKARTLERLEAVLAAAPGQAPARPAGVIKSFHHLVMIALARGLAFNVDTLLATDFSVQRPRNPQWLAAARINRMAMYLTAVELQVDNAELARALGCTRANVFAARRAVEDLRDDKAIDELLRQVTFELTGRQ
jgi:transcriptional regulator with XRE-family HTH domain